MMSKMYVFTILPAFIIMERYSFVSCMVISKRGSKVSSLNKGKNVNFTKHSTPKIYTLEEIQKMSIPQAIQEASSVEQLLDIGSRLWLPTDDNLLPHFKTQAIHHKKRVKAASQLLLKLGDMLGKNIDGKGGGVGINLNIWSHEQGLKRTILAASLPFILNGKNCTESEDCNDVANALLGIHSISGYTIPNDHLRLIYASDQNTPVDYCIIDAVQTLIDKAESSAWSYTLREACEVRWAIQGIGKRIRPIRSTIPQLDERTSKLPFDILPSCLDWSLLLDNQQNDAQSAIQILLNEIPFKYDTITTKQGKLVKERRSTAWVAEANIGSLAYSGKLMAPSPIPPIVRRAMRRVEEVILNEYYQSSDEQLRLCREELGGYFDCSLCNHYPDEHSACKFHTDPEHGTFWERLTCVVCAGDEDVRKFAFRPIPDENVWSMYESKKAIEMKSPKEQDDILPAAISLFPGDVVKMFAECNDVFHHAVYGANTSSEGSQHSYGRVSLVFKRAMDRGNGKRGHSKRSNAL